MQYEYYVAKTKAAEPEAALLKLLPEVKIMLEGGWERAGSTVMLERDEPLTSDRGVEPGTTYRVYLCMQPLWRPIAQ